MFKSIWGRDNNEQQLEDDLLEDERVYAFSACMAAGLFCMFLSYALFAKPIKFALMFSFGNMFAVGSTTFLTGPGKQIRMMFDPVRVVATVVYVISVILALVCALGIHSIILSIFATICEVLALLWYGLSYIPFVGRMVSNMIKRLFDRESR